MSIEYIHLKLQNLNAVLSAHISPFGRAARKNLEAKTRRSHFLLNELGGSGEKIFDGPCLIDGMWWNPNHWLRYTMFRAGLGLARSDEIGLLGRHSKEKSKGAFEAIGVNKFINFDEFSYDTNNAERAAKEIVNNTKSWEEFFELELPFGFPPEIVFDGLLKRQKSASVNLQSAAIVKHLTEAIACLYKAEIILNSYKPKLLVLSHSVNFSFGSLAWQAIRLGIPAVVVYGEYGSLRFWKIQENNDVYMRSNFLSEQQLEGLTEQQRQNLTNAGGKYLTERTKAQTIDIGAKEAFGDHCTHITREEVKADFNWANKKPIIAVFGMSGIDYPHLYGKMPYFGPVDWILDTIKTATEVETVNWLIRPHPLEKLRAKDGLKDYIPKNLPANIRVCIDGWNGNDIMKCVDGLITMYGTSGLEYAAQGMPVLSVGPGWYGESGISLNAKDQTEYRGFLRCRWWEKLNLEQTKYRAEILSGWHFCQPAWKAGYRLGDDFSQSDLYLTMPDLIENKAEQIRIEISRIRSWWASQEAGYHSYLMKNSEDYSYK